jgi:hypothetical protein
LLIFSSPSAKSVGCHPPSAATLRAPAPLAEARRRRRLAQKRGIRPTARHPEAARSRCAARWRTHLRVELLVYSLVYFQRAPRSKARDVRRALAATRSRAARFA